MDGMIDIEAAVQPVAAAPSSLRWYALQTHPAREYRVRRWLAAGEVDPQDSPRRLVPMVARDFRSRHGLDRMGYEIWLPECVTIRCTRSRIVSKHQGPWFPAYLFIRLDLARHDWRAFDNVDGIAGFLLDGGKPRALPEGRIEGLKAECDAKSGMATIAVPARREFIEGQKLRVLSGPFAGFDALFAERANSRIVAMLDLFGRTNEVEFEEAQLEAAS
jgi:transcriptional antiterminator RfaH